jgi:hypothetical protein
LRSLLTCLAAAFAASPAIAADATSLCTVAFRKAGNQQVEVKVATADAKSAPP